MSSKAEAVAMVLDRLMHDPALRGARDEMIARLERGGIASDPMVDQIGAAVHEAGALLDSQGPSHGAPSPEWARIRAMTVMAKWGLLEEQTRLCEHQPRHTRPQPVFAAAWIPDLVVCKQCTGQLWTIPGMNYHCDCCATVTFPVKCWVATLQIAELTWIFYICAGCRSTLDLGEGSAGCQCGEKHK